MFHGEINSMAIFNSNLLVYQRLMGIWWFNGDLVAVAVAAAAAAAVVVVL